MQLAIEEKLVCVLKKDGGLETMEVQGTMMLEVGNEEDAACRVHVDAASAPKGVQFKTHPNIDKALHAGESVLGLKDASKPFPTGSQLGILKWRLTARDESEAPLQVTCWPSVSGALTYVTLEYDASGAARPGAAMDLLGVVISVPLPALREAPAVSACDGDSRYDARRAVIEWQIDVIDDSNRSGTMEFSIPAADPSAFFPIDVRFSSKATFCGIKVTDVTRATGGAPIKFACSSRLVTESVQVQ